MKDRGPSFPCGLLAAAALLCTPVAPAQMVWYVDDNAAADPGPGDPTVSDPLEDGSMLHPFDAIQEAVDAAAAEDEIVVRDGLFTGVGNKNIAHKQGVYLHSEHGPGACILDLGESGYGVRFTGHNVPELNPARLEGLTIRNGTCGVRCSSSLDAIIRDCVITRHIFGESSGGVRVSQSGLMLSGCLIEGNTVVEGDGGGVGIDCRDGFHTVAINDCVITNNIAEEDGGGIRVRGDGEIAISGCWIANNETIYGCGGG